MHKCTECIGAAERERELKKAPKFDTIVRGTQAAGRAQHVKSNSN